MNAGLQTYGFVGSVQSLPVDAQPGVALAVFRAIAVSCLRGQPGGGAVAAPIVARTIVRAFCQSPGYESTRRRFPFLELIPDSQWTDEMIAELEQATTSNRQISEAGLNTRPPKSAPAAVRELVERLRSGTAG